MQERTGIMIVFVEGSVRYTTSQYLAVDTGGIGVAVYVAQPESCAPGQKVFFYTYEQIREDSRTLFGFETQSAYELFCSLIEVKGIGCRTAMSALGKIEPEEMARAIETADIKTLRSLPGIGPKSASQIILDLKGKIVAPEPASAGRTAPKPTSNPVWEETQAALIALGYKPQVLEELNPEFDTMKNVSVDQMLRKALQRLALKKGV